MARKETEKSRTETLHERAMERFRLASDAWKDNHAKALADMKFRALDQWPEEIKKRRKDKKRPTLVVDKIGQYLRQVVNDSRQNRPGVNVRPVDDKGDAKVANAFKGIIRRICSQSNADEAFDTSIDHGAGHGFGFFRLLTDYVSDSGFEQDIYVRRIRNSLSVLLDPAIQLADGSDAEFAFVIDNLRKDEFKRLYPKAEKVDFKVDHTKYAEGWLADETVRVCEYWHKEYEAKELFLLEDGTTATQDELDAAAKQPGVEIPRVIKQRTVQMPRVKWCRLSGAEVLEEKDWAGKYIPIIPVFGTETDIEGKVTYSGLVRPAMGPQMLYNYSRSAFAERVALAPKVPWLTPAGVVENYPEWETANEDNHPYLRFDTTDAHGNPSPSPKRVDPADVPAGFSADMQLSEHDIQSSIGMYAASLGQASNEKSGRAIMARQREGDTATFHYQDNLNRAIRYLGRQLVDLIPHIYDSERVVRVLGEDGKDEAIRVNPALEAPSAKIDGMEVFNLNAGRYDVDVSAGPSYTTKRQESADAMIEMTRANPNAWTTHGDLIAKAQDWPAAEEWAKRSMATMPPELKAAIAKEDGDDGPDEKVKAIIEQANRAMQERDEQIAQMGQALQQAKEAVESKEGERLIKEKELEIKAYQAETDRLKATAQAMSPEQVQAIVLQTLAQLQTPTSLDGAAPQIEVPPEPVESDPMAMQ